MAKTITILKNIYPSIKINKYKNETISLKKLQIYAYFTCIYFYTDRQFYKNLIYEIKS